MKKEEVNFNMEVKDVFGEIIKDRNEKSLKLNQEIVNILNHPNSIPEGKSLDIQGILLRLEIQKKLALKEPQVYSTKELTTIQDAVVTLVNNKSIGVGIAGIILDMTN